MDVGINVYWPGKRLFPESRSSLSLATPIHMSGTAVSYRRHPPLLGEHTGEVLNELVYNTSEVRIQGKSHYLAKRSLHKLLIWLLGAFFKMQIL